MGYVPTGYYGGLLAGRLLLAEPTYRFGERRMLLVYSAICVCLQLIFWLQPSIVGSAVALSLMGFFFGPFFATVSFFRATYPIMYPILSSSVLSELELMSEERVCQWPRRSFPRRRKIQRWVSRATYMITSMHPLSRP